MYSFQRFLDGTRLVVLVLPFTLPYMHGQALNLTNKNDNYKIFWDGVSNYCIKDEWHILRRYCLHFLIIRMCVAISSRNYVSGYLKPIQYTQISSKKFGCGTTGLAVGELMPGLILSPKIKKEKSGQSNPNVTMKKTQYRRRI